jgi:outer membrane protein assembly factor BamE (lipoprotein component of BamABCDE complex)
MLHARTRTPALSASALLLLAALALLPTALAQKPAPADQPRDQPPFHEYKGVRIGMAADEARKLLGNPTDKDDKQEVFAVNDNESCQVYYDAAKKVSAVSITYYSSKAVPSPKAVLGEEPEAKQDGSFSKLIRFPKAGYWVSYTRTSGDSPMTIIAMQRLDP